jgi:hypothetical protein
MRLIAAELQLRNTGKKGINRIVTLLRTQFCFRAIQNAVLPDCLPKAVCVVLSDIS